MQCNILLNRNMRQLKYYVHQLFVFRFTYMGNLLTKMSNILLFPKYIYILFNSYFKFVHGFVLAID